jgi:hypothetical protein
MSLDINLTNVQSKPIVVSANQTAENDRVYNVIANATFTDPTGVNGKGYFVVVRSGTSVVLGGNSYTAGETIYRIFNAGTWLNIALRPSTYESLTNKKTTLTDNSDTFYPTQKAVKTAVDAKFNTPTGTTAQYLRGDGTVATFPTIPSITGLVPYTGATQDVDLGEYELKAGQVEFDQTPTGTAGVAVMRWNDTDGTIDLGLKGGNVTLQLGQEQLVRVVNKTATNINLLESNYQAVRVTGAQGQRLKVDLAQATTDALSAETIGLVTETINNNQEGFITTSGLVRGINTTGSLQSETWADGDVVYLSPTTAGRITNVKPSAPNHLVIIGYVVSAHATQGSIFVKVDNGYELDELHNVAISTPLNNQSLVYETATTLWKNKALTTADIADSTDKRYVTDANLTVIGNTSNTNTGDETQSTILSKLGWFKIQDTTAGTTSSGTSNTISKSIALPFVPQFLKFRVTGFRNSGSTNTFTIRAYLSQVDNNIGGTAILIATVTGSNTAVSYLPLVRNNLNIVSGNIIGLTNSGAQASDDINISSPRQNQAIPTGTPLYLIFAVQCASALDTARIESVEISNF